MKHLGLIVVVLVLIIVGIISATAGGAAPRASTVWAVVNVNGTLARGSGALSAAQFGANGFYEVTFNRDVSQCAYVATSGEAGGGIGPDDGITLGVAPREGKPDTVALVEYDTILKADSYSSGFHLVVTCT